MADDKGSRWVLITIAFGAGAFLINLFKYMNDEESRVINKEISKLQLDELRNKQAARIASAAAPLAPSTAPESTS